MNKLITIVDYGLGNLHSVKKALFYLGFEALVTEDAKEILRARRVILPGVGAFREGMAGLRSRGLVEILGAVAKDGVPLLGICLGAQLLFAESEEFGPTPGLGLIPGRVAKIPGERVKIPHVGWAQLKYGAEPWTSGPLKTIPLGSWTYFVHSYHMLPEKQKDLYSVIDYGPNQITAAIRRNNVVGFQFHPEKSGNVGLEILKNFCLHENAP